MALSESCNQQRLKAIISFRVGMEGKGSAALVDFIDCLAPEMENNSSLVGAEEANLFEQIFSAQQRGDYIFLADLLEYVLPNTKLGPLMGLS